MVCRNSLNRRASSESTAEKSSPKPYVEKHEPRRVGETVNVRMEAPDIDPMPLAPPQRKAGAACIRPVRGRWVLTRSRKGSKVLCSSENRGAGRGDDMHSAPSFAGLGKRFYESPSFGEQSVSITTFHGNGAGSAAGSID